MMSTEGPRYRVVFEAARSAQPEWWMIRDTARESYSTPTCHVIGRGAPLRYATRGAAQEKGDALVAGDDERAENRAQNALEAAS